MITTRIPYPGLRPFERSESDIFFGREEQTDQLLRRLENSRFLAVVGPSGCGKSSLVRAGMIAALETGYMAKAGARWRVATTRPGGSPFRKLAAALLDKTALGPEREGHDSAEVFLETTLRRGPLGLVEALRETPLPQGTNLLLLVDQFEEVFRFRATADQDEADAFVALLLQSSMQREVPVYVVLTMRSDYIGDCAVFTGLPEALNESQYLTPRLTREQRRSAIVGPARVFGGDVEPQLVNRILNEMGPEPDLLPVFQHLLMRMWTYDRGVSDASSGGGEQTPIGETSPGTPTAGRSVGSGAAAAVMAAELEAATPGRVLTLADYRAVGGFSEALSKHANEVFDSLDEEQKKTATLLFRRLCERGGRLRDVRRPTPMREIMALAHLGLPEVTAVADAFRQPEHSFLVPLFPEPLIAETVLDITHESLIRQWDRLNKWVELEEESARTYRFLEETSLLWKKGKAALWGTPNLEEALSWQQSESPAEEWAKRYGGDFSVATEFLEASRKKRLSEEAQQKARQEQQLRRAHRVAATLALTLIALVSGILAYCYLYVWNYKADYATLVKKFGEPQGIGPLTSRQLQHRAASVRVIRKGRLGRVTEMQAVDSRAQLAPINSISTYLEAPDQSPLRECVWKFAYDSQGRIAKETAYNRLGKMVWGFVYSPSQEENSLIRDGYYLGPDGYPRQEKGSAASFLHIEYSPKGFEQRVTYRDRLARPMPGPDKAFGREMSYDDAGNVLEVTSLDANGKPMNDEVGNSILRLTYDGLGNALTGRAYDATGLPTLVNDGWSGTRSKYDRNGNNIEVSFFDQEDRPILNKDGYHRETIVYDDRGFITEQQFWDIGGHAAFLADGYHAARLTYDDQGNLLQVTYTDGDGRPVPVRSGVVSLRSRYDGEQHEVERVFLDVAGQPMASKDGYSKITFKYDDRGNNIEVAYFETDGVPTRSVDGYARFTSEYDANDHLMREAFYDANGKPTNNKKNRYASTAFKYDDHGNRTETAYFGVDGLPVDGGSGYAVWRSSHDEAGNAVTEEYFGVDGKPVLNNEGYAKISRQYDYRGKATRTAYLGLRNEPVRDYKEKIAGWTSEYDAVGNETGRAFFDVNERPVALAKEHYASSRARFDRGGHTTELALFDVNHKPTLSSFGYSVVNTSYDSRGNITEQSYFDIQRRLTLVPAGEDKYARVVNKYDEAGNQIESAYFGTDGKPIMLHLRYHSIRRVFDTHNNPVEFTYYGLQGEPVETSEGYARRVSHFDKYGNMIDEAIFKLDGRAISVGGCSKHVNLYDTRQNRSEERCLGLDGRLAVRESDGFAVRKFLYDERGNQTEVAHFGKQNEPIRWFGKWQYKTKFVYDNDDNKIEERYFDTDGRPMTGWHDADESSGDKSQLCARWTGKYDRTRKLIGSQCAH